MGLVILLALVIVALVHGTFGLLGVDSLFKGFALAKTRKDALFVSLIAAGSLASSMALWGWGTTLFKREDLAFMVGFGNLFVVQLLLYFFLPSLFSHYGQAFAHAVKAGIGIAIPASTSYYIIYMFYISH